ncbi:hypothetical protein AgCh_017316 [Apium graveolens]
MKQRRSWVEMFEYIEAVVDKDVEEGLFETKLLLANMSEKKWEDIGAKDGESEFFDPLVCVSSVGKEKNDEKMNILVKGKTYRVRVKQVIELKECEVFKAFEKDEATVEMGSLNNSRFITRAEEESRSVVVDTEDKSREDVNSAKDISTIAKDAKVRHLLHSAIDNVMSNRVINCKTAKEIWDALETRCQGTDSIKKNMETILTQEYEHFDSKPDESLTDNYALYETTLDEIYGMVKTHELEMDQRSKRHERKSRTVALKAEEESPKVVVSKKGKGKALITKSDTEASSSDSDKD